jgi:hypothetical protein
MKKNDLDMKLYRFRKLSSELDCCRLREIIETSKFWCSNFWELNDPMEGVFNINIISGWESIIGDILSIKSEYKICSFTGEEGFKDPAIWGYYADGFKGVAIEVETNPNNTDLVRVDYDYNLPEYLHSGNPHSQAKTILKTKSEAWVRENEYRFLVKSDEHQHKIGKITAIYFGTPYEGLASWPDLKTRSKTHRDYENYKKHIIKVAKRKIIRCYDVDVKYNTVTKNAKLLK